MGRNVEINIPMFIGIILLVAITTCILVYGVNATKSLMEENNNKYVSSSNSIQDWINTLKVDSGETKNEENINNANTTAISSNIINANEIYN